MNFLQLLPASQHHLLQEGIHRPVVWYEQIMQAVQKTETMVSRGDSIKLSNLHRFIANQEAK